MKFYFPEENGKFITEIVSLSVIRIVFQRLDDFLCTDYPEFTQEMLTLPENLTSPFSGGEMDY